MLTIQIKEGNISPVVETTQEYIFEIIEKQSRITTRTTRLNSFININNSYSFSINLSPELRDIISPFSNKFSNLDNNVDNFINNEKLYEEEKDILKTYKKIFLDRDKNENKVINLLNSDFILNKKTSIRNVQNKSINSLNYYLDNFIIHEILTSDTFIPFNEILRFPDTHVFNKQNNRWETSGALYILYNMYEKMFKVGLSQVEQNKFIYKLLYPITHNSYIKYFSGMRLDPFDLILKIEKRIDISNFTGIKFDKIDLGKNIRNEVNVINDKITINDTTTATFSDSFRDFSNIKPIFTKKIENINVVKKDSLTNTAFTINGKITKQTKKVFINLENPIPFKNNQINLGWLNNDDKKNITPFNDMNIKNINSNVNSLEFIKNKIAKIIEKNENNEIINIKYEKSFDDVIITKINDVIVDTQIIKSGFFNSLTISLQEKQKIVKIQKESLIQTKNKVVESITLDEKYPASGFDTENFIKKDSIAYLGIKE